LASKNRVASISSAIEIVSASDVVVNASNLRIARIDSASVEIFAISAHVERNVAASGHSVTEILSAGVIIVASLSSVDAHASSNIA